MTPKEKAKELVDRFYFNGIEDKEYSMEFPDAIKCALICVDEMLGITPMYTGNLNPKWKFLEEVKQEIEKL